MSANIGVFPQDNNNDLFSRLYDEEDDYLPDAPFANGWEDEYNYGDLVAYDPGYRGDFRARPVNPAIIIMILAALFVIVFVGMASRLEYGDAAASTVQENGLETAVSPPISQAKPADIAISTDALTFEAPYTDYVITQGIHGASYGHMAIDIAAGRGEPLLSPINGVVTQLYMDEYGNPTILIENDIYQVMFLHGDYSVAIGDTLKVGQQFGTESNKGYTMDMAGNLCYNREWCGNHSHLNVFDKRIQSNVNPLGLFGD